MKLVKTSLNAKSIAIHVTRNDGKRLHITPKMKKEMRLIRAKFLAQYFSKYKTKHKNNIK